MGRTGLSVAAYVMAVVVAALLVSGLELEKSAEYVLNPSASRNLSDWEAHSDQGIMRMTRVRVADGPGAGTAVEFSRSGDGGAWTYALAGLRDPASSIRAGKTYRMRAYVRDLRASGQSIGIALANRHYSHQPTPRTQYVKPSDSAWHLLQRTFRATRDGTSDLGLYVDLPTHGPLRVQITRVSLRSVTLPRPRTSSRGPTRTLTFPGKEGDTVDPTWWAHEVGGHGWGNAELQTYTAGTANAHLDGHGSLLIIARRERARGPDGITRDWTSARIGSTHALEIPPGSYVEASIKAPTGEGLRPAFWLVGANEATVRWPACGELDVMEGSERDPAAVLQTMHMSAISDPDQDAPFGGDEPKGRTVLPAPRDSALHRYGVYFDQSIVQFYVDGVPRLSLTRDQAFEGGRDWPFDQPQRLALGLAVVGEPDVTRFPAVMEVSRVSVWDGVPSSLDDPDGDFDLAIPG